MRINSAGNVGIGTSSVESTLHLQAASAGGRGATLTIDNNATSTVGNESQITFLTDAGASVAGIANARIKAISTNAGDGRADLTFTTWNGSVEGERLRIDASGNLMVGDTYSGLVYASRGGNKSGHFNRQTSDGEIVVFSKDGTTVGSIGTVNNDIYIGTGNTALRFTDGATDIRPVDSTGANLDATTDLGASATRFRKIYLSGGVVLDDNPTAVGGDVTSKTLDDYEEGTWTPVLSAQTGTTPTMTQNNFGSYTKVGRLVSIIASIEITAISGTTAGIPVACNLPFTANNNSGFLSAGSQLNNAVNFARSTNPGPTLTNASSFGFLSSNNAGGGYAFEDFSIFSSSSFMRISLSYYAA
jgi:hypothetical protein